MAGRKRGLFLGMRGVELGIDEAGQGWDQHRQDNGMAEPPSWARQPSVGLLRLLPYKWLAEIQSTIQTWS